MIIILVILIVWWVHIVLYWLYWWQVKEYRVDRMKEWISNNWNWILFDQFDVRKWFRPKMTFRMALTLATIIVGGFVILIDVEWWWLKVVLTPLVVGVAVEVWQPVFNWQKQRIIRAAKARMKNFKGTVIGITGSYGKSSTKEILKTVLQKKFRVAATEENVNSEIGVAMTVLKLKGDEEIFIVEMGAYKIGEIRSICEIVRPKIGIITGIGDQHLALFGSLENIKRAKYELVESLPKDGLGLVAGIEFKLSDAKDIKVDKFEVSFNYQNVKFSVAILGKELIRNVIGVIKTAKYLGMTLEEISAALGVLSKNKLRPYWYRVNKNLTVIDDSYNASRESFINLIDHIKLWQGFKKIVVTPGMIELGERAGADHREIGERLAEVDKVWLTNRLWKKEMGKTAEVETDVNRLIAKIRAEMKGKTLVVFKGRVPRVVIDSIINEQ